MCRNALWLVTCAAMLFGVPLWFVYPTFSIAQAEELAEPSPVGPSDASPNATTLADESTGPLNTEHSAAITTPIVNPNASTAYTITPVVANEKAKPRDIIKKELTVTNNTKRSINVYISVRNMNPSSGEEVFESPSVSDLSTSLANWIEITRGVIKLGAGESRKIPYLIHVNLTAKPGSYFARIQFTEGPRRNEDAGSGTIEDGTSLMLNVEVLDDADERLQLGTFTTDDSVVTSDEAAFNFLLENVGNREIEPRGSIRIFNRKGEEVGTVPLNSSGEGITPENKKQLAAVWDATGRFGRYKAFLDLEYGESQRASVQDTVYFWVFPWKEIMMALFGVGLLAVIGTYVIHMRSIAHPVPVSQDTGTAMPHGGMPARVNTITNVQMPSRQAAHTSPPMFQPAGSMLQGTQQPAVPRAAQAQQGAVVLGAHRPSVRVSGAQQVSMAPTRVPQQQSRPTVHGDTIALAPRR